MVNQSKNNRNIITCFLISSASIPFFILPSNLRAHEQNSGHWGAIVTSDYDNVCWTSSQHNQQEAMKDVQNNCFSHNFLNYFVYF